MLLSSTCTSSPATFIRCLEQVDSVITQSTKSSAEVSSSTTMQSIGGPSAEIEVDDEQLDLFNNAMPKEEIGALTGFLKVA